MPRDTRYSSSYLIRTSQAFFSFFNQKKNRACFVCLKKIFSELVVLEKHLVQYCSSIWLIIFIEIELNGKSKQEVKLLNFDNTF